MSIVVKNLSKYFGAIKAVDNISFTIYPGEIVGLLGPNGAGKTTMVRLIIGYLSPTRGQIEVYGKDVRDFPYEVRRMIGYIPEDNPLYTDLDIIDYLTFIAELQDVEKKLIPSSVKKMIETFGLENVKHIHIGSLSKGYRQRVALAQAMIHDPDVLLLDEPTNGLDPNQTREFRTFLERVGKNKTVIISTHTLTEVQATCNRAIIMGRGKILVDASLQELEKKYKGTKGLFLELEGDSNCTAELVLKSLESIKDIISSAQLKSDDVKLNTLKFFIEFKPDADIRNQIFNICVENKWKLLDLHLQHVRIEEIFHQVTGGNS